MASRSPDGDKRQTNGAAAGATKPSKARCPICSAPTEAAFRPFCSRRCADVDLSRWLRGAYAIPGRADVDEDGDDTTAAASALRPQQDGEPEDA